MKAKYMWVLIAISFGVMKGEEGFFPIIGYGLGHHKSGSWVNEKKWIDSLGLNVVVGERALPEGKAYDDTLLYEVCEPTGVKLLILIDPNVPSPEPGYTNFEDANHILGWFHGLYSNDYPHEWDAKGDFTGYGRIKFRDGLKWLADSLSMHMNSLTGKRIKDHNASMAISSVQRVQRHIAQSIIKP